MNLHRMGRVALAAALIGGVAGCESEIQHGLTEKDANDIRVALSKNGISADKKREEGGQTPTWMIVVPKAEVNRATEVLVTNHLPPEHPPTFEIVYGQASMVPTASEEKGRFISATQGEIAKSLESVDGVLSARVNINKPDVSDLEDKSHKPAATAAVVVTYKRPIAAQGQAADTPPISEAKIKAIVARGVGDLLPENIEVSLTPASLPGQDTPGEQFVDIAGLRMSTDSVGVFKTMAAIAILGMLALAGWIAMLYYTRGNAQSAPRRRAAPEA